MTHHARVVKNVHTSTTTQMFYSSSASSNLSKYSGRIEAVEEQTQTLKGFIVISLEPFISWPLCSYLPFHVKRKQNMAVYYELSKTVYTTFINFYKLLFVNLIYQGTMLSAELKPRVVSSFVRALCKMLFGGP